VKKEKFIPVSLPDVTGNEKKYLNECIDTGWVSSIGSFVQRFEEEFAAFCHQPFGVSVNNGTAALHLALRALDVGPGDEVILPALTFPSTANVILYLGATPVFADCQADNWNIDPDQITELITTNTKAIMPVHLYGLPCAMDKIMALAEKHNLMVVEDCAEAHGATYNNKPVGSFGTINCFSFFGNKIITTGEGGICVTSDPDLQNRLSVLRDHGMDKKRRYWHNDIGYNYRMTNLQAAVGCAQLERIHTFIEKKRWVHKQYNTRLADTGCLLPDDIPPAKIVFWLYTLLLPEGTEARQRDELIKHLADENIDSRPVFYPVPDMPPYKMFTRPLPNAARISKRGITLPSHQSLSESDIERICQQIRYWLHKTMP